MTNHDPTRPETEPQQTPEERKEAAQAYEDKAKEQARQDPLPKVDMNTFILSLSSSAMVHLGEVNDPESGKNQLDLNLARHTLDMLAMLEEKTKGNLSADEEGLLKNILFELRMKYVQKAG
jgi:hypothetical protein